MQSGNNPQMQSYASGLPSINQAHADYSQVTSDHLPILATIPVENVAGLESLKIVSWNVLEDDGGNGFAKNGNQLYGETNEQRGERHNRIALSLQKMVAEHKPAFITLQEISISKSDIDGSFLLPKIQALLPENYGLVSRIDKHNTQTTVDYNKCITIYDKKQFAPNSNLNDQFRFDTIDGNITKFKLTNPHTNFEIRIANTHHPFSKDINTQSANIRTILNGEDNISPNITENNSLSIIVGDFNGTIAPLSKAKYNRVTSVAPSKFEAERNDPSTVKAINDGLEAQNACSIDGGFYLQTEKGKKGKIVKATIIQINPATGQAFTIEELKANLENMPSFQKEKMTEKRPAISIDHNIQQTLKPLQDKIDELFPDQMLPANFSSNNLGETGLAFTISDELAPYFSLLKSDRLKALTVRSREDTNTGKDINITFVLVENKDADHFIKKLLLAQLQNSNKLDNNTLIEFNNLYEIIDQDNNDIVKNHFNELALQILNSKDKLTVKEIEKSAKALDTKLYGKPPLSIPLKAAICGVIGALVGLTLGVAIGAGLTFYAGGFGAIPGAILGAVKGFTVGTALAAGTLSLGAVTGSGAGFFSAYKNNNLYQKNKALLQSELKANSKLINETDATFNALKRNAK